MSRTGFTPDLSGSGGDSSYTLKQTHTHPPLHKIYKHGALRFNAHTQTNVV